MLQRTKSAYARSTVILKSFPGWTWIRRQTRRTAVPTEEKNPARNELNGNVPTTMQYTNWITAYNVYVYVYVYVYVCVCV